MHASFKMPISQAFFRLTVLFLKFFELILKACFSGMHIATLRLSIKNASDGTMKYRTLNQQDKVIIEIGALLSVFVLVCIYAGVIF